MVTKHKNQSHSAGESNQFHLSVWQLNKYDWIPGLEKSSKERQHVVFLQWHQTISSEDRVTLGQSRPLRYYTKLVTFCEDDLSRFFPSSISMWNIRSYLQSGEEGECCSLPLRDSGAVSAHRGPAGPPGASPRPGAGGSAPRHVETRYRQPGIPKITCYSYALITCWML